MKNFYYTLFFLVFSLSVTAQAQDTLGVPVQGSVIPITRIITVSKTKNSTNVINKITESAALMAAPAPTGASTEVGITEGKLSVSLAGAATYSIPIVVPPGINGVVPQVDLVYNSQSGNGVAGYGWNISGVSAITRVPHTKFHDGVVGNINLHYTDRYALDGQRLILKSGVEGAEGAIYETENFSNIKITASASSNLDGTSGPASFKVEYPDGSMAMYGATTDSRSVITWSITYWQNAQGVRISYSYLPNNNNTLNIEYIKYGNVGTGDAINEIKFIYVDRLRPEQLYVGGQSIINSKILDKISVSGNSINFRTYTLTRDTANYQRLIKITETSSSGVSYNPTEFTYDTTADSVLYTPTNAFLNFNVNTSLEIATISGDFGGDEEMDFISYPTLGSSARAKYWCFSEITAGVGNFGFEDNTIGKFETIFPVRFLSNENNILRIFPKQGWSVVKKTDTSYTFIVNSRNLQYATLKNFQYERVVNFPTQSVWTYSGCNTQLVNKMFPKRILSGDFNGDGLTDVIAIDMTLLSSHLNSDCRLSVTSIESKKVYFIDLKRDNTTNFLIDTGQLASVITDDSKIEVADVNGDGKSDFLIFENGKVTTYTLNNNNQLNLLWVYSDNEIFTNAILGDYNGDGKTDFIIPQAEGSQVWYKYSSTGTYFIKEVQNYSGIPYSVTSFDSTTYNSSYRYIASDYDKDGKSDLILTKITRDSYSPNALGMISVICYKNINGIFNDTNSSMANSPYMPYINFDIAQIYLPTGRGIPNTGNPYNSTLEIAFLSNYSIYYFNSSKNNKEDRLLRTITTGNGVRESITYEPLSSESESEIGYPYTTAYNFVPSYPNTLITSTEGIQVVTRLEKEGAGTYKKQLFSYADGVSNLEGLGFLGFRASMHTNWYNNEDLVTSSVSKFDYNLRGANIENYNYLGFASIPSILVNAPVVNTPRASTVIINNTRTVTETVKATNRIRFLPGANIKPIINNTFKAQITPDYDANGYLETNTNPQYGWLISKSLSFYEANLSPTKVYRLQNTRVNSYNIPENTSTETNLAYDVFNNPTESINKIRNSGVGEQTTTTIVTYDSSLTPYIVGRPKSKTETLTSSGDTMTSKETYDYYTGTQSNLIDKIHRWGNNTAEITEANEYDLLGNVTKKTTTAGSISRSRSYVYNPASPYNGRFLTESTDVAGFKTAFEYYPNGTLQFENRQTELNKWDPGTTQKTSYTYDPWFKKKTITDYLGKVHTYSYTCANGKATITLSGDPTENSYSEELYDELGRKIRTAVRDVQGNNSYSYQNFKYDIYDRNYSVSEPYATETPLYNTTTYDVYGRPETVTDFTGKVVSMAYNKLTTTVTTVADGITLNTKTSVKNAIGNVISMTEAPIGGTINYSYFANGNLKETNYTGNKITITQDGWGRKTSLTDPSAGLYTYEYNALGEMTKETTPNGSTTFNLDALGRPQGKTIVGPNTDSSTQYSYNAGVTELLKQTKYTDAKDATNWITTDYIYDGKKRLETIIETTGYGAVFTKTLSYDPWGRIDTETSEAKLNGKSSKTITQNDYKNGFAYKIKDIQNPKTLWETTEINARGQLKKATLGNGIKIENIYDSSNFGYLANTKYISGTSTVMELTNEFAPQSGNLTWRKNSLFDNVQEDFKYDTQDRLLTYPNALGEPESQSYKPDGRIDVNAVGTYNYANTDKRYQNTSVLLKPEATGYYTNREGLFDDSLEEKKGWNGANKHPYGTLFHSYDTSKFHSGNTSLKLTNTTTTEQYIYAEKWVDIDNAEATKYTYSAWVYSENPDTELFLAMKKADGTVTHDNVGTAVKNQWYLLTKEITVPANIKKLNIRLDNNGSGNVWFDDIKIIRTTTGPDQALVNIQNPDISYKDHQLNIKYSTFKSPVEIIEADKEKMNFVYNDNNSRSVMFYGSLEDLKTARANRKYYSADRTMEIKTTPTSTEFVTYIGGDGYSAPVVYKKTFDTAGAAQEQMLYLHRDYQGSILAITNATGTFLEKRQFDAWGAIIKVQDGVGNLLNGLTILDRGYTGHEHLQSVGLIHMNGRLYDPKLHRFLQPDNYVQDPFNTQNYNRYSYVLNNPLKYTDFCGECWEDDDPDDYDPSCDPSVGNEQQNGATYTNGNGTTWTYNAWQGQDDVQNIPNTIPLNTVVIISSSSSSASSSFIDWSYNATGGGQYYGGGGGSNSQSSSSGTDIVNGFTGTFLTALDDFAQTNAENVYKYGAKGVSAAALTEANAARMLGIAKGAQVLGNTLGLVTGTYTLYNTEMQRKSTGEINYKGYADGIIGITGGVAGTIVTFGLVSNPIGWGFLATSAAIYGIGSFAYDAYNYKK